MRYPAKPVIIMPKDIDPITEDLLTKLGMDTWPESFFILETFDRKHATEKLKTGVVGHEDAQILRGLACFENEAQAADEAAEGSWVKHEFHPQEIIFDAALDIAKSKPRLNCMILHRSGKDPLIFNL
jgi:hypothetical protein